MESFAIIDVISLLYDFIPVYSHRKEIGKLIKYTKTSK